MFTMNRQIFLWLLFPVSMMTATFTIAGERQMNLTLESPDFARQGEIPKRFTCDGSDISPALQWTGIPQQTRSLVLIVDDPDAPDPAAPKMTWVHWLLYNLPPSAAGLPENVASGDLPPGTLQGKNDWKRTGYGGLCPPIGRHRYFSNFTRWMCFCPICRSPTRRLWKRPWRAYRRQDRTDWYLSAPLGAVPAEFL